MLTGTGLNNTLLEANLRSTMSNILSSEPPPAILHPVVLRAGFGELWL